MLEPQSGLACSIGKQTCLASYRTGVAVTERTQVLLWLDDDLSRSHNKQKGACSTSNYTGYAYLVV